MTAKVTREDRLAALVMLNNGIPLSGEALARLKRILDGNAAGDMPNLESMAAVVATARWQGRMQMMDEARQWIRGACGRDAEDQFEQSFDPAFAKETP